MTKEERLERLRIHRELQYLRAAAGGRRTRQWAKKRWRKLRDIPPRRIP